MNFSIIQGVFSDEQKLAKVNVNYNNLLEFINAYNILYKKNSLDSARAPQVILLKHL